MELTQTPAQFKELLKAAVIEVFQERPDLLAEAVSEALEDEALVRATEEARAEGLADMNEVAAFLALRM